MSAPLLYRIAIDIFFFRFVHNSRYVQSVRKELNSPKKNRLCAWRLAPAAFAWKLISPDRKNYFRTPLALSSGKLSGKLPFNSNDSQEFYGEERRRENICAKKKRLTRIRPIHVTRSLGRRTGRVQRTFSMRTRSGDMCTALLSIFPFLSGRSRSAKGNLNVC